jgi:hypothetical protein
MQKSSKRVGHYQPPMKIVLSIPTFMGRHRKTDEQKRRREAESPGFFQNKNKHPTSDIH